MVGMDMSDYFIHLVERVLKIMSGWKDKIIFKIPAYAMSIFKILKKYAKNLRVQYHNSGGAMISMIIKCIGLPSGNYAFQKGGGDFCFRILILSI
jgi:hypothetical protein